MPLAGTPLLARDCASILYKAGWTDARNLEKMLATADAESNLYSEAFHWNDPADGGDGSTDWGWLQLNDGNAGGHAPLLVDGHPRPSGGGKLSLAVVTDFANMATDPAQAAAFARALYVKRGLEPWVAYTSGAWKKLDEHGDATHILKATRGIMNFLRALDGVPPL